MRLYSFNDARSFESLDAFERLYIFRAHLVKRLRLKDSILLNNLHGVMFHPDEASETCKFKISTLLQINRSVYTERTCIRSWCGFALPFCSINSFLRSLIILSGKSGSKRNRGSCEIVQQSNEIITQLASRSIKFS